MISGMQDGKNQPIEGTAEELYPISSWLSNIGNNQARIYVCFRATLLRFSKSPEEYPVPIGWEFLVTTMCRFIQLKKTMLPLALSRENIPSGYD